MLSTTPKPLTIATAADNNPNFIEAIDIAAQNLDSQLDGPPCLVIAYHSEASNNPLVSHALNSHFTHSKLIGASSCKGAMTDSGLYGRDQFGVALWAISDPQGHYGVGFSEYGFNVPEAAIFALEQALKQAGAGDRLPSLVWMHASPGSEEAVISAINAYFLADVPIVGGSCADNTIEGNWHCLVNGRSSSNGVAIAVMFPSTAVGYSFKSAYFPTEHTGIITRGEGRTVYELDDQPAAEVYNRWLGGQLDSALEMPAPHNILSQTTLFPLGRIVGYSGKGSQAAPDYLLLHPEKVTEEKGLSLFANINEGETLQLMRGSVDSLIHRAGQVIEKAQADAEIASSDIAGGLVIYCAGCMLTVDNEMPQVVDEMRRVFQQQPFIGAFTFGEQGCLAGGQNLHGNLMIASVVFSRSKATDDSGEAWSEKGG